jgi:hypothetical protein
MLILPMAMLKSEKTNRSPTLTFANSVCPEPIFTDVSLKGLS